MSADDPKDSHPVREAWPPRRTTFEMPALTMPDREEFPAAGAGVLQSAGSCRNYKETPASGQRDRDIRLRVDSCDATHRSLRLVEPQLLSIRLHSAVQKRPTLVILSADCSIADNKSLQMIE